MIHDVKLVNVILLGFSFMFVFTAFQTTGNIEKIVLDSVQKEDSSFKGDGYTSLAVIYSVFATSNWLSPSIISVVGPKYAMIIGAFTYLGFIASFLYPLTWLLYLMSAVIGFGAAVIWTGQGNFLTLNSDSTTISRNSGIFWAMLQCSLLIGNLFVFFEFEGKKIIDHETRTLVFIVLLLICGLGLLFLFTLRPVSTGVEATTQGASANGPFQALKKSFFLFFTKEMMLLSCTFFYTGIELSFFSGVYSPSIGFTEHFGIIAKRLVGLSGIFIGCGEILGGLLFGLLGKQTNKYGRDPIVLLGYIIHMLAFYIIFVNLPDESPLGSTDQQAFIHSNEYIAMFCSFLLGFGDSCFNTQLYSILGGIWQEDSAPAFALFKFAQSLAAATCFFYSSYVGLYIQLAILVVLGTIGTMTFFLVEWKAYSESRKSYMEKVGTSCLQHKD